MWRPLIIASLALSPMAAHAASFDAASDAVAMQAAWSQAHFDGTKRVQDMDLQPRDVIARPYDRMKSDVSPDAVPTKVSWAAPVGVVGSVGLVHMQAPVDRSVLPNAVANQPGLPSSTAGASLTYQFH